MSSVEGDGSVTEPSGRALVPRLVALACLVAVGVVVAMGVRSWLTGGEPRPWRQPKVVDGTTVLLTYVDSTCRNHEHVEVRETPETVTVTIRTRTVTLSCSDAIAEYTVEVVLDAPLGDRALLDGACTDPRC